MCVCVCVCLCVCVYVYRGANLKIVMGTFSGILNLPKPTVSPESAGDVEIEVIGRCSVRGRLPPVCVCVCVCVSVCVSFSLSLSVYMRRPPVVPPLDTPAYRCIISAGVKPGPCKKFSKVIVLLYLLYTVTISRTLRISCQRRQRRMAMEAWEGRVVRERRRLSRAGATALQVSACAVQAPEAHGIRGSE